MVWSKKVLDLIQEDINKKGYFHCPYSFKKFARENGLYAPLKTPKYVSIDYWSGQNSKLRDRGWYVSRLSKGSFGIFSKDVFEKPYLDLKVDNAKKLDLGEVTFQPHVEDAFRLMMESSAENSILELVRSINIYDLILEDLISPTKYIGGPRGNFKAKFNLHFQNKSRELITFKYNGQLELDYSIWTEDKIFIIEAKSEEKKGLDIGWHKLAFPSQQFSSIAEKHEIDVVPIYLLRNYSDVENRLYLFVFPPYKPTNGGLILNDRKAMQPEHVYSADLNELLPLPQRTMEKYG